MNRGRTILLTMAMGLFTSSAALAAKEAPAPKTYPNRLNYKEQVYGGSGGSGRVIDRSWQRPDGAKVTERTTYGTKLVKFKNAQNQVHVNTGRVSIDRTIEGANMRTTVRRSLVGDDRGTKTEKTWKTNRYSFSLTTSTKPSDVPRKLQITDGITGTVVILTDKGGRKPEVEARNYSGKENDPEVVKSIVSRGVAILKSRARPQRAEKTVD